MRKGIEKNLSLSHMHTAPSPAANVVDITYINDTLVRLDWNKAEMATVRKQTIVQSIVHSIICFNQSILFTQ